MSENVGAIVYTVDMDTAAVTKGADRVNVALDDLNKGFDKVDASAASAESGLKDVADALSKTTSTTSKTTDAVNKTSAALDSAGKATDAQAAALRKLLGQIDPTVAATQRLDQMTKQLGQAFDRGLLSAKQYETELGKLDNLYEQNTNAAAGFGSRVQELGRAFDQATAQNKRFNAEQDKGKISADGFGAKLTPLAGLVAGVVTAQTLAAWGKLAEQFTLLQARITRLTPDLATASTTYSQLLTVAAQTGQTMPATVKLWETLTSSLKSLGATNDQVLSLTSTLQKIGKIGGSSADETANALRQLGQSLSGGTLRAEEFNSIVEQTPELIRQLAAGAGMSMGQFRQAMLDGKITSAELFDLLQKRTADVDAEFKKLPRSVSDAANAITVQFGAALAVIDKASKASVTLAYLMDKVARGIELSFNPTNADQFNKLLQERANILDLIATKQQRGDDTNVENARLTAINKEIKAMQDAEVARQKANKAALDAPKPAAPVPQEAAKELKNLQEKNALLQKEGEARAVLAALQQAGVSADSAEGKQIAAIAAQNYQLQEAEKARQKSKQDGIAASKKSETEAAAAVKKENEEAQRGYDANQKTIQGMAEALTEASLKGEDLAVAQAKAKLNKFASPEDVAEVERLTKAIQAQKQAQAAKTLANTVDPNIGAKSTVDQQLKDIATVEQAGIISAERAAELKLAAETNYHTQVMALQEQQFKAASEGNALLLNGIDALGQSGTQALSGLLSGTSSLKDALGGVANTVLNAVIGSFVTAGTEWVKQEVIKQAAVGATTAAQTAGMATVAGVQAATTGAIAATTTTTAAATGTAVAGSMAPAAGLSSIASFGGAAVIGGAALLATMLLAKSFGGGRQYGGGVAANKMYRVNEGGAPEIFNAAGGKQYMMPNSRGEVVSNKDATSGGAGGSGAPVVNVNNYSGASASASTRFSEADRKWVTDVVVGDMTAGGQTRKVVNQITGTKSRGS